MAVVNSQSTLVGLFKETYGKNIVEAWGFMAKLANRISFVEKALQPGNFYNVPVDLVFEHGITATAAGTTAGIGSAPFLAPSAGQMQNAQVVGAQLIGRSQVAYEAIARSQNDKAAFKSATQAVVRRLSQAVVKRLEIQLLHGQQGIGTISANPANGASRAIVLTDASWAAGIWAGEIGATLDLYTTAGVKTNANTVTITGINTATKTITVSVTGADQTLDLTTCPVIFFETASPTSEMAGLSLIAGLNSSSSTLFNISPASYDLWQGNQVGSVGTLTFAKLESALSGPATYGLQGRAVAVVSPKAFAALGSDLAALRMYDTSYSTELAKNGSKNLAYYTQTGELEIMAHPFQKDGQIVVFVPDETSRVGAQDVDFITRSGNEQKLILESSTSAASEMRCYSNQSVFVSMPRHMVLLTGVTY